MLFLIIELRKGLSTSSLVAMPHNPNASDSHELRPLTGIRGFAAIAVVIFHYFGSWEILFPDLQLFTNFASQGWLGVDLFFS